MEKKPIQAKNVVSFGDGSHRIQPPLEAAKAAAEAAEAERLVDQAAQAAEKVTEPAVAGAEATVEAPAEPVKAKNVVRVNAESVETKPLSLRTNRYLDEEPQEPDWADELEEDEEELSDEELSTFAEVFLPLQGDSVGAIVRKGMVIVSIIVIICCAVAIIMKQTAVSGTIYPEFSAAMNQASQLAHIPLSTL